MKPLRIADDAVARRMPTVGEKSSLIYGEVRGTVRRQRTESPLVSAALGGAVARLMSCPWLLTMARPPPLTSVRHALDRSLGCCRWCRHRVEARSAAVLAAAGASAD